MDIFNHNCLHCLFCSTVARGNLILSLLSTINAAIKPCHSEHHRWKAQLRCSASSYISLAKITLITCLLLGRYKMEASLQIWVKRDEKKLSKNQSLKSGFKYFSTLILFDLTLSCSYISRIYHVYEDVIYFGLFICGCWHDNSRLYSRHDILLNTFSPAIISCIINRVCSTVSTGSCHHEIPWYVGLLSKQIKDFNLLLVYCENTSLAFNLFHASFSA